MMILDRIKPLSLLWLICAGMHITTCQTMPAGIIGNRTEDGELTPDNLPSRHFYLNFNAPATINGTVSSLRYCFILNTAQFSNGEVFLSTVGFYRPRNNGYTLTNTVVISFDSVDGLPMTITNTFHCREMDVPEFEVQIGDVIGVCLREFSGTERVNVYANLNNGYMLRSSMLADDSVCVSPREMPSDLSNSMFAPITNRLPLVSAEIIDRDNSGLPTTMGMPISNGGHVTTVSMEDTTGFTASIAPISNDIWFIVAMVAIVVAVIECLLLSSLLLVVTCKRRSSRKQAGKKMQRTAIEMQDQQHYHHLNRSPPGTFGHQPQASSTLKPTLTQKGPPASPSVSNSYAEVTSRSYNLGPNDAYDVLQVTDNNLTPNKLYNQPVLQNELRV